MGDSVHRPSDDLLVLDRAHHHLDAGPGFKRAIVTEPPHDELAERRVLEAEKASDKRLTDLSGNTRDQDALRVSSHRAIVPAC